MSVRDQYVRKGTVAKVVDGDTIDFDIDLGWHMTMKERCRLLDVDTPEMRGPERPQGIHYQSVVVEWLARFPFVWVECVQYRSGKYGRSLVRVYSENRDECLNDYLAKRLAAESTGD